MTCSRYSELYSDWVGGTIFIARRIVTLPSTPLVLIWVMVMSPAIDGLVDPNTT